MYNQTLNIINNLPSGTKFEYTIKFFNSHGLSVSPSQIRIFGKRFSEDVDSNVISNVNKLNIINNQGNYPHKNTSNLSHYIKI